MPSPQHCAFLLPQIQSTLHKRFCQDLKALPNRERGRFLNGKKKPFALKMKEQETAVECISLQSIWQKT
jgi:hypothetical protein